MRFNSEAPPLVEVFIDGKSVEVPAGTTVLAACAEAGVEIPRYKHLIAQFLGEHRRKF